MNCNSNNCMGNNWWWIIILILIVYGQGGWNGNGGCGC